MKRTAALLSMLCLVFSASAASKGDTYIYGGVGYAKSSMEHDNLSGGKETVKGMIYGAGLGHCVQQNMAIGAKLMLFPYDFSDSKGDMTIKGELKTNIYMGTFTLFVPMASGGDIFILGGVGIQSANTAFTLNGEKEVDKDENDGCWMLGGGLFHPLTPNLALVVEATYYSTQADDLEGELISAIMGNVGLKFDIN